MDTLAAQSRKSQLQVGMPLLTGNTDRFDRNRRIDGNRRFRNDCSPVARKATNQIHPAINARSA
jgi:hypothetical protein